MNKIILFLIPLISIIAVGCGSLVTRTERDIYTITEKDTTNFREMKNAPGNRDNGIIYPSSRTVTSERKVIQRDSLVERTYPNFIRLGLFESIGIIGGASNNGLGTGLFGIFPDFNKFNSTYTGESGKTFTGGIYRVITGEWRLRWFRDSPNWTIGTSSLEMIFPSAQIEKSLISMFPLYIRKKYYLSETIPYVSWSPYFGFGYLPSQYINLGANIEVGSIGGMTLRAYLGFAAGNNSKTSPQVVNSINPDVGQTVTFPYFGIGIGFLDFINIVPETYKEWKEMPNSSWNIGIGQFSILNTGAESAFTNTGTGKPAFSGFLLKVFNTSIALPFYNNKFYIGTSLLNLLVLGQNELGLGILPIRFGYLQTIIADELSTEPFIESNYYPSSFIHIGNRFNLRLSDLLSFGIVIGYASGNTSNNLGSDIRDLAGTAGKISRAYIGVSFGIGDRIFYPEEIRYNK